MGTTSTATILENKVSQRENEESAEGKTYLGFNAILFTESGLLLEVTERGPIVWRVRGHGGDNTGGLLRVDGEHGEDVNLLVLGERSL